MSAGNQHAQKHLDVQEKWEKYSQLLILLTPKLRFGPTQDGCPWQQLACLCDSSSLASKILWCSASHKAKCELLSSAWVTANDQLRSPFSGFCVKWHPVKSAENNTYWLLFALNKTQPPTSSESGCHQLYLSALQPLPKCCVAASGSRYIRSCVLLGDVGCYNKYKSVWIVWFLTPRRILNIFSLNVQIAYKQHHSCSLVYYVIRLLQQLKTIFRMHFPSVLS